MGGAGHSLLTLALEQPEWDAEADLKGVELLPAVRPQQFLVRRGCLQPVDLSCLVPVVCIMVLSAVQQRSTSLQYLLVRAVPRSVA